MPLYHHDGSHIDNTLLNIGQILLRAWSAIRIARIQERIDQDDAWAENPPYIWLPVKSISLFRLLGGLSQETNQNVLNTKLSSPPAEIFQVQAPPLGHGYSQCI